MDNEINKTKQLSRGMVVAGVALILALIIFPLATIRDSEFAGSDGQGSAQVESIAPDYDTGWSHNIWEPPGSETESMYFALQAAFGGLFVGYVFGFLRGRQQGTQTAVGMKSGEQEMGQSA